MTEKENIKSGEDFREYLNREVLFSCDFKKPIYSYNRSDGQAQTGGMNLL